MSLHVVHMVCLSRMFWPKEIWGLYGEALADFKDPSNASQAVQCLNHMVTDALRSDMSTLLDESPVCHDCTSQGAHCIKGMPGRN